jgi:hypothetical protein
VALGEQGGATSPGGETPSVEDTTASNPAEEGESDAALSEIDADHSFTGQVRALIEKSLKDVSAKLTDIEVSNAQTEPAGSDDTVSTKKPGWFARLRHRRQHPKSSPGEIDRVTSRRIRRTFLLGFVAAVVGTSLLVWRQHPFWAIVWLFASVFLTLVKAMLNALFGWRREKVAAKEERDRQVATINKVITEATVRSNVRSLSRRLSEVADWNSIVGLVIHHPWRFGEQLTVEPSEATWKLPLSVVRAEGVLEGSKVEALKYQFNGFLFQKGWLGARMKELEDRALNEMSEVAGQPGEGVLQAIEGDTSLDPDSPRRRFLTKVRATLLSEDGDPDLRAKVNEFLGDNRPLGVLIAEVREYEPSQELLKTDHVPIDDFFVTMRQTNDGFLVAHWLDGRMEGESKIAAAMTVGDGKDATVVVRTESDSGAVMPARMLCLSIQRSERLGTDNLRAFQPK